MELKLSNSHIQRVERSRSNRTFMELKLSKSHIKISIKSSSNRTFMELKYFGNTESYFDNPSF